MKTDLFQSCGHRWVFQIFGHIECSAFPASSFRVWNSSTGIPSPPLALFVAMLSRPTWLHIPGCLSLDEWSHHHDYLGCEDLFCTVLCIHSVMSSCLWSHGLYSSWNSLGQNTGVGSWSLLQGFFLTQASNPGLPHCRQILYQLSHQGSPGLPRKPNLPVDWNFIFIVIS